MNRLDSLGLRRRIYRRTHCFFPRLTEIKVQQELLRHADLQTTMNVYTQVPSEANGTAQNKVVQMVSALLDTLLPIEKHRKGRGFCLHRLSNSFAAYASLSTFQKLWWWLGDQTIELAGNSCGD